MANHTICVISQCGNPSYGRSEYCKAHHRRWKTHGDPLGGVFYAKNTICSIDGCGKPAVARELCSTHWMRWSRNGDPTVKSRKISKETEVVRWIEENRAFTGDNCLFGPMPKQARYTQAYVNGKTQLGHRLMCEAAHGPAPDGKPMVLHSCGNGHLGCVNPNHLRWGTHSENMEDKRLHGRTSRGVTHGMATLTDKQVLEIKASEETGTALSRKYGVSSTTIYNIRNGKTWTHL